MQKLQFLKSHPYPVLIWPAVCLLLGSLLWGMTLLKLDTDRHAAQENALKSVASLSGAYAQYLTRTIEQMDQIAMQVQYEWHRTGGVLDLKDFRRQGLLIAPQFINVTILNKEGLPVSSTVNLKTRPSAAAREYFIYHRSSDSLAARVGMPVIWPASGNPILPFTRRLNAPDGSFDGVVAVSIGSGYFSEFYNDVNVGNHGLLAMVDLEGTVRTARMGDVIHTPGSQVLRHSLTFSHTEGSARMDGSSAFADGRTRYVGWRKLQGYPFMAMVGISEAEALAPYHATEAVYRNYALGGSVALLGFGLLVSVMATRLQWRKQQINAIRTTYRVATEGASEGFYMLRPVRCNNQVSDFEIVDCNERGAVFYGMQRSELLGQRFSALMPPVSQAAVMASYVAAFESGWHEDEIEIVPGGALRLAWAHRRLVRSGADLAVTLRDISENKLHKQQMVRMAKEDALTGLHNRQWLAETLPDVIARTQDRGTMLVLLLINLDRFRQVNNTAGHQVGDDLLKAVARRMRSVLRPGDHAARLGGDEFTVLMECVVSEQDAIHAAERICAVLSEPFALAGSNYSISASVGISIHPNEGDKVDADKLLTHADMAMHAAREQGRGGHHLFEPYGSLTTPALRY